tara:strand:+ start:320 stop:481 length:162 start_codon:yes stop_codon:yes gene_type:complete
MNDKEKIEEALKRIEKWEKMSYDDLDQEYHHDLRYHDGTPLYMLGELKKILTS